jgi:uncharacterized membrane protein YphA (DoxX/SURF4 family)
MFPSGPAGIALLLLRISAASLMVATNYHYSAPQWLSVCAVIAAVALLIGFFARFAAALCAAFVILFFVEHHGGMIEVAIVLHAAGALAVALLGPGAYSIDAFLFGRRVIQL